MKTKCDGCKRAENVKGEYVYTCNCGVETLKQSEVNHFIDLYGEDKVLQVLSDWATTPKESNSVEGFLKIKGLDSKMNIFTKDAKDINYTVYSLKELLQQYANQSLPTDECKHNYEHYTNEYNETVAVCSKCMSAYF